MAVNQEFFDGWSLVHLGVGIILGVTNLPRPVIYPVLAGFEAVENLILKPGNKKFGKVESSANITSDIVIGAGGYEIGRLMTAPQRTQ